MTIGQWKTETAKLLKERNITDTYDLDARLMLEKATALDHVHLILEDTRDLSIPELTALNHFLEQRLSHKPMAYILGTKEFFGRPFKVDEHTLIPRPDTETLVETVLLYCKGKSKSQIEPIIDVCTGTGAIGITLALELDSEVTLCDISKEALHVADLNAKALIGSPLSLVQTNLLSTITRKYAIIVSNPPYLTTAWCDEVSKEVAWEPRLALDGLGPDGLDLIRALVAQSAKCLIDRGALFLECDYRQTKAVASIMESHNFKDVTIVKDLAGHERVVWGVLECTNN